MAVLGKDLSVVDIGKLSGNADTFFGESVKNNDVGKLKNAGATLKSLRGIYEKLLGNRGKNASGLNKAAGDAIANSIRGAIRDIDRKIEVLEALKKDEYLKKVADAVKGSTNAPQLAFKVENIFGGDEELGIALAEWCFRIPITQHK